MFLGYNTNGLAHHDLFDAVEDLLGLARYTIESTRRRSNGHAGAASSSRHILAAAWSCDADPAGPEWLHQSSRP